MRYILAAVIVTLSLSSNAMAETLRLDQAEKAATSAKPLQAKRTSSGCAAFGAGFVKVDGTDTCVKLGGFVSVGASGAVGSR